MTAPQADETWDALQDRVWAELEALEAHAPAEADRLLQALSQGDARPYGEWLTQRWRERREILAHGTLHGVPVFRGRRPGEPVHLQLLYHPDGTCESHAVHPLYPMAHYRQRCKYCDRTHPAWWMMDQRDYLDDDYTILLCGRCEHTSPQDHETRQHKFSHLTEAQKQEAWAHLKAHGVATANVEVIPRHRRPERRQR